MKGLELIKMHKADPSTELNSLRKVTTNKKCFDCAQSGTTYIISEFGIFVCSRCAGLHREFSHRAKGLSMCTFSPEEIVALRGGNETAAKKWHNRVSARDFPDPSQPQRIKDFIRQTFLEKRFFLADAPLTNPQQQPATSPPATVPGSSWATFEAPKRPQTIVHVEKPVTGGFGPDLMFEGIEIKPTPQSGGPPTPSPTFSPVFEPFGPSSPSLNLFPAVQPPVQVKPPASSEIPFPSVPTSRPNPEPSVHTIPTSLFPQPTPPTTQFPAFQPFPARVDSTIPSVGPGVNRPTMPHIVPGTHGPSMPHVGTSGLPGMTSGYPQPGFSGHPSMPVFNPFNSSLTSVWNEGVKDDPFSELVEQDIERQRRLKPQPSQVSPQQQLWQQFCMQAQMYTQMHGTQYPYSFQAWLQMLNLSPTQSPPISPVMPEPTRHYEPVRSVSRSTNPFDGL